MFDFSWMPSWLFEFLQNYWPSLVSGATIEGAKTIGERRRHKNTPVPIDNASMKAMLDSLRDEFTLEADTNNRELAQQVYPLISSLKVNTAHEMLATLRQNTRTNQQHTLSVIDYLMGCCSRFIDEGVAAEEFERAFREMIGAERNDLKVMAGNVYALCVKGKKEEAIRFARGLKSQNPKDIWTVIPELVFADDFEATLAKMSNDVRNNPTILYYSYLFRKSPKEDLGVDVSTYTVSMPETLTYDNLPEWLFGFSVLITRFLWEWDEMMLLNEFTPGPACTEFHDNAYSFLTLRSETELQVLNPDIELFSLVTEFIITGHKECLDAIPRVGCTEQMNPFRFLAYAAFHQKAGYVEEAKEYLIRPGVQSDRRTFSYRFYLAYLTSDLDYAIQALEQLISQKEVMPSTYLGYLLLNVIKYPEVFVDYIDQIPIVNVTEASVFRKICHSYNDEEIDFEYLRENLNAVPSLLRTFVAMAFHFQGDSETAIEIFDQYAKPEEIGIAPYLYISLLKETKNYRRLDCFLKERREKGFADKEDLLTEEYELAAKQDDYARMLEITEALLVLFPGNPSYVTRNLFCLLRTNQVDKIKEIAYLMDRVSFTEEETKTVFGILQEAKLYEEAIDFLFTKIKTVYPSSENLLILFRDYGANSNCKDIVLREYDTVQDGLYVFYTHNGDEREEIIHPGQRTECLIGRKVGETITQTDQVGREDVYHIEAVHNKYKELLDSIDLDIVDNKFDTAFIISGEDLKNVEHFEENLRRILGISEEDKQFREESLSKYKDGELSLGAFIKKDETIASIYERLFDPAFHIYTTPSYLYDFQLPDHLDCKAFILDLSALILLYETHLRFGIEYDLPLTVPRGTITLLESTLLEQSSGFCGKMSSAVMERLLPIRVDETDTWFETRIRNLLAWIKRTITIQDVPEMVDVHADFIAALTFYYLNSTQASLLASCGERMMVSEDLALCKSFSNGFPIVSANWILHHYCKDKYPEISIFMLECGFVGIDLDSKYVFEQYEKYANGQPSTYLCCKENFGYQSVPLTEEIELCKSIYKKEEITDADKLEVKSILTNLLENDNNPHLRGVLSAACACYPAFKKALEDALDISSDNKQDEDSNND